MNTGTQTNRVVNSDRWISFLESTAKGLQVNITVLLPGYEMINASDTCPVCNYGYESLTEGDIKRALYSVKEGLKEFTTEKGDSSILLMVEGSIPFVVRDCPVCSETGNLPLLRRAEIAQKLLNSFYYALAEGFRGGSRAIEISTLRHMNHITLSLFQGKEDAARHSFDLILSALIIILDARASWLEFCDPQMPEILIKGDRQAVSNFLSSPDSSGFSVKVCNGRVKGQLGVVAPAGIEQARELLPLMAQEVAIVIEIDKLFKLFHKRMIRVLEAIDSAIIVVDKNGTISYANYPCEQLTGLTSLDIIGKPAGIITGPWSPYIEPGKTGKIEGKVDVINLNNKQICVDWQVSHLIEDDSVQGWVVFIRDRTDYYRWREAVRKAERLAVTASLVGSLAHELRNPLSSAKALLQLTRQKSDNKRSLAYIDLVQREIDRVTRLLNEFLLLGKPAVKIEEPVPVASFLRELTPLLESEVYSHGSEFFLEIKSEPLISADAGQLTQLVMNLVRNAAEASGENGKVFITLQEADGQTVLIIKDTGPGITDEVKAKLFKPFFTTKERGTGLGLSVVQAIALNHGGEIQVGNALEGGAIFRINLPSYTNGESNMVDVLMIINDTLIKYPAEQAVKGAGFKTVTAANLEEGLQLACRYRPALTVVESALLSREDDINVFKLLSANTRVIILGENSLPDFGEHIFIDSSSGFDYLVSRLRLAILNTKNSSAQNSSTQNISIKESSF